jgi:hypothetical protein
MAVLREAGMIRHFILKPQPTEPAIRQVEVNLLAKPTLRANPEAITHQQHPDHQLRIDGRPTSVTVEGLETLSQLAEVEEAVNSAQKVDPRGRAYRG